MKFKRLNSIKINCKEFEIIWDNTTSEAYFSYNSSTISIGTKNVPEDVLFMILCHELLEICSLELHLRLNRPDCASDYVFVMDHRQFDNWNNIFSSVLSQFLYSQGESIEKSSENESDVIRSIDEAVSWCIEGHRPVFCLSKKNNIPHKHGWQYIARMTMKELSKMIKQDRLLRCFE